MSKPNLVQVKLLFVVLPLLFLISCKSTPSGQQDDLLFSLLPQDSQFYLCFPVQQNLDLAQVLVTSFMPDISSKNRDKLLSKIGTVYGGFSKNSFSASVSGSFPKMALGFVLKEKNGWSKVKSKDIPVTGKYYLATETNFQLAFPTSTIGVFGKDVTPLLENYNNFNNELFLYNNVAQFFAEQKSSNSGIVSFYVKDLGSLLPSLVASNIQLSFPFGDGYGYMIPEDKNGKDYQVEAFITLKDNRALRPAIATLKIISRVLDLPFQIESIDNSILRIYGMSVSSEQMAQLVLNILEE